MHEKKGNDVENSDDILDLSEEDMEVIKYLASYEEQNSDRLAKNRGHSKNTAGKNSEPSLIYRIAGVALILFMIVTSIIIVVLIT